MVQPNQFSNHIKYKEYRKQWHLKNRERRLTEARDKYKNNQEIRKKHSERQSQLIKTRKKEAFISLGGVCKRCGFSDDRALQIDHIRANGSRNIWRNSHGATYYKRVIESVKRGFNNFQLLCANCNWIKRFENNEHRGLRSRNLLNANSICETN